MTGNIRVMHLMGSLRPSGMERMLQSSAGLWAAHSVTPIVVAQGHDHPFAEELTESGYPVVEIREVRGRAGLSDLLGAIHRLQPDVLHVHTESAHGPVAAMTRARAPRIGQVRTVHNVFSSSGFDRHKRVAQHRLAQLSGTHFVACSEDVRENEDSYGVRCQVVENWVGIDFTRESGGRVRPDGPLVVGVLGNCSPVKNHELLLRTVSRSQHLKVLHVGDSTRASPEERRHLRELETSGRLIDLGARSDVRSLMDQMDAFAMPSLNEGMPVALMEAMTAGLPCFISDAPGMRWARDLPGVRVMADGADWAPEILAALNSSDIALEAVQAAPVARIRFSAVRGVAEYCEIYARMVK